MVYVLIVDDDEDDRDLFCDAVNMVDSSINCIHGPQRRRSFGRFKKPSLSPPRHNFFGSKYAAAKRHAMFECAKTRSDIEAHTDRDLYNFKIERRQKSSHAIRSGQILLPSLRVSKSCAK